MNRLFSTKRKGPKLYAIVAMDENNLIGYQGKIPWYIPTDLKHFKQITNGGCVLMGRKTYESIGKSLPGRINIVLTRDPNFQAPGCIVGSNIDKIFQIVTHETMFVIGGSEIFHLLLSRVERIYLTRIHTKFFGTSYFPTLDPNEWNETEKEDHSDDNYDFSFSILERKIIPS